MEAKFKKSSFLFNSRTRSSANTQKYRSRLQRSLPHTVSSNTERSFFRPGLHSGGAQFGGCWWELRRWWDESIGPNTRLTLKTTWTQLCKSVRDRRISRASRPPTRPTKSRARTKCLHTAHGTKSEHGDAERASGESFGRSGWTRTWRTASTRWWGAKAACPARRR